MKIDLSNFFILLAHVFVIGAFTLLFLRKGVSALTSWCVFLAVIANLFVHKQIMLFGLSITCSDALAVGYLLGTNLIQEFFGLEAAKKSIVTSLLISAAFPILSLIHLQYHPSAYDTTQSHFSAILTPLARITIASIASFFIVQVIDLKFFSYLREKTASKHLTLRLILSSLFTHGLDTVLFSFLGLYGSVHSIASIIFFSLCVKMLVVLLASPFMALSKRFVHRVPV
jgi:uncharacterized integral membrane protein (TIGR00697 family)